MDLCGEISGKIFARVKMAYEDDFHCHCVLCIIWVVFNLKSKVIKIPDACWEKEGEWKEKDCVCLEREGGSGVGYGWLCGFDTGGGCPWWGCILLPNGYSLSGESSSTSFFPDPCSAAHR